jgi:hypothetical protein
MRQSKEYAQLLMNRFRARYLKTILVRTGCCNAKCEFSIPFPAKHASPEMKKCARCYAADELASKE